MKHTDVLIQIFCKAPVLGEVKTRLAVEIGNASALEVYEALASRILSEISGSQLAAAQIWCVSDINHSFFDQYDFPRHQQRGQGLGERMANALTKGLLTHDKVILIGADIPVLDSDYLESAINALKDHDAVLGPAEDGGYGLIGVSDRVPDMFKAIEWSTDQVLTQTCRHLNKQRTNYALLPYIWDVDRPEDLLRYRLWLDQP